MACAVVLLLHALALLAVLSVAPHRRPESLAPQFVSVWPEDRLPAESRAQPVSPAVVLPVPAPLPRATALRTDVPADTPPERSSSQNAPAVDWQREAALVARSHGEGGRTTSFGKPPPELRKPCKIKERVWFYEPKRPELPPGAVALGKHCVLDLPRLVCTAKLGAVEMDTDELVAALREDVGESVPDPETCD